MEKIDVLHHKFIVTLLILLVLITGVIFGVRIASLGGGADGLLVLLFALVFLLVMLAFVNFTQVVHLRDDLESLLDSKKASARPAKKARRKPARKRRRR